MDINKNKRPKHLVSNIYTFPKTTSTNVHNFHPSVITTERNRNLQQRSTHLVSNTSSFLITSSANVHTSHPSVILQQEETGIYTTTSVGSCHLAKLTSNPSLPALAHKFSYFQIPRVKALYSLGRASHSELSALSREK